MKRINKLREQIKIQSSHGNWNYDPYMHGMANGLICALATMENKEAKYLDAPEKWLSDITNVSDRILNKMFQFMKVNMDEPKTLYLGKYDIKELIDEIRATYKCDVTKEGLKYLGLNIVEVTTKRHLKITT